jgi:hypothetical protein
LRDFILGFLALTRKELYIRIDYIMPDSPLCGLI